MSFSTPWLFVLIIPLIAAFIYSLRKPQPALKVSNGKAFAESGSTTLKTRISRAGFIVAGVLIVIALAGPRFGIEHLMHRADGIDMMLALDLSGSMLAYDNPKDGEPLVNRLAVAKDAITRFVKRRPNDRIGLVAFGSLPFVASPPTLDHGWMLTTLDGLKVNSVGGNTGIAGPIVSSVQRLKNAASKRRILVLFTDGANNVDVRLTPRRAAELAQEFGVTIYTVGIGGENSYVMRPKLGSKQLEKVDIPVDRQLLKEIAEAASGIYFDAGDAAALDTVMSEIDSLERTVRDQPKYVEYKEFGPLFAALALLLLLFSFVWRNTIGLVIP